MLYITTLESAGGSHAPAIVTRKEKLGCSLPNTRDICDMGNHSS